MDRLVSRFVADLQLPWPQRYAAATAIVGAAFGFRFLLSWGLGASNIPVFIPAVFVTALAFDSGAGIYATVLGALLSTAFPSGTSLIVPDEIGEFISLGIFVAVGAGIAVMTETLRSALRRVARMEREKDLLLREFYHRVANDLQRMTGMLTLSARRCPPEARTEFKAASERILVLGRVYGRLRRIESRAVLPLKPFLEELLTQGPAVVETDIEDVEISIGRASGLGMIVNELVTNACKHAFPDGRPGRITVRFRMRFGAKVLVIADDGVGMPAAAQRGLGSVLVADLVRHMGGRMKTVSAGGTRITVILPLAKRGGET